MSEADCPKNAEDFTCDMDNHIIITATTFVCFNPGPQSECKGRTSNPRIYATCTDNAKCVKGLNQCVRT
jgi:hypothetical protein